MRTHQAHASCKRQFVVDKITAAVQDSVSALLAAAGRIQLTGANLRLARGEGLREVAARAGLSVSFFLDRRRRELEVTVVSDKFVWEHNPKFVLDELGHLFT